MAKITHKLEFLVNAGEPVTEINNIIFAFLQFHPGREAEILTQIDAEISKAITHYEAKDRE